MAQPDSQRTPPSDDEAWWWELWTTLTIEFGAYLLVQIVGVPYAIVSLAIAGRLLIAAALTVLWAPTIVFLVRDVRKSAFSRVSWGFLIAWTILLVGWLAYGYVVV
jgi:hypothetical protein